MSKKWEYKVWSFPGTSASELQIEMNQFGQEGWELVAVLNHRGFFKRPIPADRIPDFPKGQTIQDEPLSNP